MSSNEKPCLVSAGQGFSVFYQNKYLYSRYNPYDAPCKSVALASIAPQSLVLAFSPLLGYGVTELLQKVPADSFVLFIEQDESLFALAQTHTQPLLQNHANAALVCAKTQNDFVTLLSSEDSPVPQLSHFRHCVPLSLSFATRLNEPFYRTITAISDNAINRFWRNRITLVRMGRLYARNIFRNIGRLPFSLPLKTNCIERPILVCGSGTSLDEVLPLIKNDDDRLFIIAVDNAFLSLLKHGIIPDRVIAVESQLANEQAFIGTVRSNIHLIADLTSRPHITDITGGDVSFMCTEYEKSSYLTRICKTIFTEPPFVPLGSVGLSAVEVALRLRKNETVPIFFCGLDFAFAPGKTHCRETPAHRALLNNCTRLSPVLTMDRTFTAQTTAVAGKNGTACITDPALLSYGKSFFARYKDVPNLYDVSDFGINTGCARVSVAQMIEFCQSIQIIHEEEQTEAAMHRGGAEQVDSPTMHRGGAGQVDMPEMHLGGAGQVDSPTMHQSDAEQVDSPTMHRGGAEQVGMPEMHRCGADGSLQTMHQSDAEQVDSPEMHRGGAEQVGMPEMHRCGAEQVDSPTMHLGGAEQVGMPEMHRGGADGSLQTMHQSGDTLQNTHAFAKTASTSYKRAQPKEPYADTCARARDIAISRADEGMHSKSKHDSYFNESQYKSVQAFYDEEEAALTDIVSRIERGEKSAELASLIKKHEYLFLHFPDGYKEPSIEPAFLNRVRCEALFFLKDIRISRACAAERFSALPQNQKQ